MKVIDHLNKAKSTLFSFEILPPLRGKGIQAIYEGIDPLIEFNPSFINVTYHREEYVYKKREKGYLEKIAIKKRPGTVGICAAIQYKYKIDAVPHLICGGFSQEETENALIDLYFLGIDNVLALRGDPLKSEGTFAPDPNGHAHAVDLVKQIVQLNKGIYQEEDLKNPMPTNFCIGVAGYPEKHFESPNPTMDLQYVKDKVDAGAEYIVTQLFYDNQKYFSFVERCRAAGITVPIIPGMKPITTLNHIKMLPRTFFIDFPDELMVELHKCTSDDEVKEVGIAWSIQQSKELKKAGVPALHFYTMGKSEATKRIVKEIF
ncbi:MAG: methylenetetrahydrofolate reductase [NAD(P)H] [Bacteroidetes bacterium]|nr:methylenetetrahydrofolate reductase [NAD(P)H] [Bacteroidota bacterium]